jgi:tetratricopeptide (TPR) repeat protein/energy-coupling factor transporter ATP-binding protein EcfA2
MIPPKEKSNKPSELTPWRTFSIFISSTFADMQAERDHLKHVVFPLVEEELQKRRIKLEIVDLRWGVDTTSMAQEDEREASVLKVCLDEIRRCRPFFIGLLGDRYGWVPPLERMKTALVGETHINPEKGKSVTDLEIEFGVLASKEQLVRSVFYFREPLPYETFSKRKAALFSDEYNTELSETEKKERKTALEKLKANIIEHFDEKKLKDKVKTYPATWDVENEIVTGLENWGNTVKTDILAECESHAKDTWDKVPQNWQEQELALLDAFIENNTATFCGRKPLLETLKKHLLTNDSSNWGVVLTGESGSGKSAVFSMMNKMMQLEDCFILAHSAGISPRAKKIADLLQIWNRQLADHLDIKEDLDDVTKIAEDLTSRLTGKHEKEPITPIEKLQEKFRELLQMASSQKRVVLLIDALDRFEPTARAQHLSWLPSVMPQNVRLLCTAITDTEKKAVQYHKGLTTKSIDSFTTVEAKEMLNALCLRQHKSLPAKIEKIILEKKRTDGQFATSSPLWLSLAVNMLMAIDHDDFERMSQLEGRGDQQIESYLMAMANGFDTLPGPLFLSLKNKAALLFGETFTAAIFNFIATSRNGLREKDLEKLLPATNIDWDALKFANLRRWFKAHLVLHGEELQWNLAHSILKSALIQNIDETQILRLNGSIADYLLPLRNDPLKATETIYHLINVGNNKEAAFYYSSNLTEEETAGATTVLTETATADDKGFELVSNLPGLVLNEFESFHQLLKRFIYELNDSLEVEGNLAERLAILIKLKDNLEKTYGNKIAIESFGYDAAALNEKLGDIHQSMGHMEEALKYFEKRSFLGKEFYEANPQNELLKIGLAVSYHRLGVIHREMGNLVKALKYLKKFSILQKELYEYNPQDESLKNWLGISYSNLGEIHQAMGHMEEALKYYGKHSGVGKELYEANPQNESLKTGLVISYSNLGKIYQAMGYMEDALKYFEKRSGLVKELYEANPQNESLKSGLAISYENLGEIYQTMGKFEKAVKYFDDENKLFKELYEANPQNESLKYNLASSYSKLGYLRRTMGHMEEALNYFEEYSLLGKELYEANPLKESNKTSLAESYGELGDIYQAMGQMEEALKYFEKRSLLDKELYESNPLKESSKDWMAVSYQRLGVIHQEMGNLVKALKYLKKFSILEKELYEANPQNAVLKEGLAISYEKLGDIHQAMGHMEDALKYFEKRSDLGKELYEANPQKESLKSGIADSYNYLGNIHQAMGHLEEALKYFELYNKLEKELYEANPQNVSLLGGLGISYYKLAMIYKEIGNNQTGREHFAEWKKIISFLAQNVPGVSKYREWDKFEY